MNEPHWPWLHGPVDQPDPRVGEMSASAANRHRGERVLWDVWMGQPVQLIREEGAA